MRNPFELSITLQSQILRDSVIRWLKKSLPKIIRWRQQFRIYIDVVCHEDIWQLLQLILGGLIFKLPIFGIVMYIRHREWWFHID
mmetsp:Transcript_501/g.1024  ORF Transcript_501/g.1024 Transcript_501/m.1024 type:complete len:85 (-) Transcript_501:52-306(-)